MKRNAILRGLLVLSVVASLAITVGSVPVALAHSPNTIQDPTPEDHRISQAEKARQHTGDDKLLLFNLTANDTVSVYVVEGSATPTFNNNGEPNGTLAGSTRGNADSKPLELFLPVSYAADGPAAKVSNVFLWSGAKGWTLLDSVIAMPNSSDLSR